MNHEIKTALDTLTPIQRRVVQDYYLSYPISQGSESMHADLFAWIGMCYPHTVRLELPAIDQIPYQYIQELQVPSFHRPIQEGGTFRADQFLMNWKYFLLYIHHTPLQTNNTELSIHALKIGYQIISRDIKFISGGRPKQEGQDRYKSYYKSYILDDDPKDMHSEVFNLLFVTIKRNIEAIYAGTSEMDRDTQKNHKGYLEFLKETWESMNKDQTFFPQRQPYI